jgi:CBS-domain-containing membrane protein
MNRKRLTLRQELTLALLPTLTVISILGLIEQVSNQRFLFSSLASSALLIYLDPQHSTNTAGTLIIAHLLAASAGLGMDVLLGPGYSAGSGAMIITIVVMILLDRVHPPAASTSLIFAFRTDGVGNLFLFFLAVSMTAVLVLLEQAVMWQFGRFTREEE